MKIGDYVKTNEHWNINHKPIYGKITKIAHVVGEPYPIMELDNGRCKINELWLDLCN